MEESIHFLYMPNVQELRICLKKYDVSGREANEILIKAAALSKLLILSFHFEDMVDREIFQAENDDQITVGPWIVALNEDGPRQFKYSLVLSLMRSNL